MKQKNDEWRAKVCAPQAFLEQIDSFVASLCEVERENLIGVYLHGSLAMGCFHPGQSDLDLLVLIQQPPTPERIHAWAHQILQSSCAPAPVELSVLVRAQYTPWQHPTPYTFHFSESWRSALFAALNEGTWHDWEQEHSLDPDLAAHFTITRRRGVRLAGTPIADAVPVVPCRTTLTRSGAISIGQANAPKTTLSTWSSTPAASGQPCRTRWSCQKRRAQSGPCHTCRER